jgi:hypothetical protein
MKNFGQGATGISGVLEPVGFDAVINRASATYPSMPGGGERHHAVPLLSRHRGAGAPSGRKAGFLVRWAGSTGQGRTEPFWVPLGAATCTTVASTDIPRAVPDHSSVESTLAFPTDARSLRGRLRGRPPPLRRRSPRERALPGGNAGGAAQPRRRLGGQHPGLVRRHACSRRSRSPACAASTPPGPGRCGSRTACPRTRARSATGRSRCAAGHSTPPPRDQAGRLLQGGNRSGDELVGLSRPGSYRVYRSSSLQPRAGLHRRHRKRRRSHRRALHEPLEGETTYFLVTGVGPNGEGPR